MAHVPTGFPRGRPRKGEMRPPTPGAVWQAQYRAAQLAADPKAWREQQAEYQRIWRLANPGKHALSQQQHRQREVHWQAAAESFDLSKFLRDMGRVLKK